MRYRKARSRCPQEFASRDFFAPVLHVRFCPQPRYICYCDFLAASRACLSISIQTPMYRPWSWYVRPLTRLASTTHGSLTNVPPQTSRSNLHFEVCGGTFVNEACVVDGNLVSGRTYHDHGKYVGVWIKMLKEAREADKKK